MASTSRRTRPELPESTKLLNQYFDQRLAESGKTLLNPLDVQGMIKDVVKGFIERCLETEMDFHLERGTIVPNGDGGKTDQPKNKRNGKSSKTVTTDQGEVEIMIPRDRQASFEPEIIPKYSRHFKGLDDKILSMYARGMSTRDISSHLREIYGIGVSAEFISRVTDEVLDDVKAWRTRPLEEVYPVVFFDALRIRTKRGASIIQQSLYLGLAVRSDGTREVIGMWLYENEGASYWAGIFNELKARGCNDILIAVTDGLPGMTKALETTFPETLHQTCIVHLIRGSTAFVSYKDRPAVIRELKKVYGGASAEEARAALDAFKDSDLGKKYQQIYPAWDRQWAQVVPFFSFPPEIRRLIYTTNSIESLNHSIRKVTKTRTIFPTEESVYKLVWLALNNITKDWTKPVRRWVQAMPQFSILFGERFNKSLCG